MADVVCPQCLMRPDPCPVITPKIISSRPTKAENGNFLRQTEVSERPEAIPDGLALSTERFFKWRDF